MFDVDIAGLDRSLGNIRPRVIPPCPEEEPRTVDYTREMCMRPNVEMDELLRTIDKGIKHERIAYALM